MRSVLFMVPWFSQGGVEHTLITALRNLPADQFELSVFIRSKETKLVPELPPYVHVYLNENGHFYRYPKALLLQGGKKLAGLFGRKKAVGRCDDKLEDYIRRKKLENPVKTCLRGKAFDVVVSYTVDDCTEMAVQIPASRRYVFYHTPYTDFKLDMIKRVEPFYDGLVACGPGVYQELCKAFPDWEKKIRLLTNYVDLSEILEKAKAPVESEYLPVEGKTLLCTCGRMAPQKRYDLAIGAAKLLKEQGVPFVWNFVGGGELLDEMREKAAEAGVSDCIRFLGNRNNPYPYLQNCDIYVQSSGFEAQPLTIIEALMLGRPIVSTETLGGVTVLENGEKGVLTPITAEGIADGILRLLRDPALRERLQNRYTAAENQAEKDEYTRKWVEMLNE